MRVARISAKKCRPGVNQITRCKDKEMFHRPKQYLPILINKNIDIKDTDHLSLFLIHPGGGTIIFYNNLRLKHWTFYQKGDFIQRKIH